MLYIDGENMIYGRLSTFVAKSLLNGEDVVIINAHKVVVTGSRDFVLKKFRERRDIGSVRKGPYYPRTPSQILRRSIGDMIPKKKTTGKEAEIVQVRMSDNSGQVLQLRQSRCF